MECPYYREFFNSYISIHAKSEREISKTFNTFGEVENTIEREFKRSPKKAGEFVKNVVKNNNLKVEIIFNGKHLIDNGPVDRRSKTEYAKNVIREFKELSTRFFVTNTKILGNQKKLYLNVMFRSRGNEDRMKDIKDTAKLFERLQFCGSQGCSLEPTKAGYLYHVASFIVKRG